MKLFEEFRLFENLFTEANKNKTWYCYFEDKEVGTVEAATEEEALEKMQDKYPEYNYGMYDGCFYVNSDVNESLKESVTDISKYKPTQKILDKLAGYRAKGSTVNVKAITNRDKLFTYFYAAKLMGWDALAGDISSSVSILDKEADEIFKEIRSAVQADASLGDTRTPDQKKLWARFKNIAQFLADNNLSYTFTSRTPFRQELDGDMCNGRCYTIAYTLEVEGSLKLYIADHTNEGGGTYGYSIEGCYMPTSKKECEDYTIRHIQHWMNNRPAGTVAEEFKLYENLFEETTSSKEHPWMKDVPLKYEDTNSEYIHESSEQPKQDNLARMRRQIRDEIAGYEIEKAFDPDNAWDYDDKIEACKAELAQLANLAPSKATLKRRAIKAEKEKQLKELQRRVKYAFWGLSSYFGRPKLIQQKNDGWLISFKQINAMLQAEVVDICAKAEIPVRYKEDAFNRSVFEVDMSNFNVTDFSSSWINNIDHNAIEARLKAEQNKASANNRTEMSEHMSNGGNKMKLHEEFKLYENMWDNETKTLTETSVGTPIATVNQTNKQKQLNTSYKLFVDNSSKTLNGVDVDRSLAFKNILAFVKALSNDERNNLYINWVYDLEVPGDLAGDPILHVESPSTHKANTGRTGEDAELHFSKERLYSNCEDRDIPFVAAICTILDLDWF